MPNGLTIGKVMARIIVYLVNPNVVQDCLRSIMLTLGQEGTSASSVHQALQNLVRHGLVIKEECKYGGDFRLTELGEAAAPLCSMLLEKWRKS